MLIPAVKSCKACDDARKYHARRMLWWVGTPAGLLLAVGALWGPLAVGLAIVQALMAIFILEDVNYIEHYGLQRALTRSGRCVPLYFLGLKARTAWTRAPSIYALFLYSPSDPKGCSLEIILACILRLLAVVSTPSRIAAASQQHYGLGRRSILSAIPLYTVCVQRFLQQEVFCDQ